MIIRTSILNLCFIGLTINICWSTAELFTAISEVEPLLETHKRIIDDLDYYIEMEVERLDTLTRHLKLYKREHEKAMEDIPNYLGNPINAFTLIKRLTTDLDHIESSIKIGTEYIKNVTMTHDDVKYPTLEDLTGAAQALTRLQDTYHLSLQELSNGELNGVTYSTPMSAGDCYELGRALYNERDTKNALAWMTETLRKYKEEGQKYPFTEADILEYIGFSHYLLGDVKTALEWTKKLLLVDPHHNRGLGNIPHYTKLIAEEETKQKEEKAKQIRKLRGDLGDSDQAENSEENPSLLERFHDTLEKDNEKRAYEKEYLGYESLCRGEMDIPTHVSKSLKCWLQSGQHPFLKYAPIKTEQVYAKPDIYIFHGVISDNEIEFIKSAAKPRFKRAMVHDPKTGDLVPAHYRISKSAWLRDEEDPIIARISQRVTDMTGLSMLTAEELQVVNYGIGGHYEPHFDFARKREDAFSDKQGGNRIATILFYMSEVAQGGATVFTELGLSLFPIKGAAAFWLNLHPSGEGDMATRHAACPVLRGSKWVCNKWLHQAGQELIKPCSLEFQEEGIVRKLPRAVPKTSR